MYTIQHYCRGSEGRGGGWWGVRGGGGGGGGGHNHVAILSPRNNLPRAYRGWAIFETEAFWSFWLPVHSVSHPTTTPCTDTRSQTSISKAHGQFIQLQQTDNSNASAKRARQFIQLQRTDNSKATFLRPSAKCIDKLLPPPPPPPPPPTILRIHLSAHQQSARTIYPPPANRLGYTFVPTTVRVNKPLQNGKTEKLQQPQQHKVRTSLGAFPT